MNRRVRHILIFIFLSALTLLHAAEQKENLPWEVNFNTKGEDGELTLPKGWDIRTQIAIDATKFTVKKDKTISYLCVKSDDSTGTLITKMEKVNLKKTPILAWKWRANQLPTDGDGRKRETDDQACGIYIGSGNILSKKSISYRWDTDTPKGTEGEIYYAMGSIKVKWFTLENKKSEIKRWITEERNIAEDFQNAWGYVPKEVYLSICGNSQHSKSNGSVDIDWIKLKSKKQKIKTKK